MAPGHRRDSMLTGVHRRRREHGHDADGHRRKQQVAAPTAQTQLSHCIGCHTAHRTAITFRSSTPGRGARSSRGVKPDATGKTALRFRGTRELSCTMPGHGDTVWHADGVPVPWNGPMASPRRIGPRREARHRATQMKDWHPALEQPELAAGTPRLARPDLEATTTTNGLMVPTAATAYGYLQPMNDPHPASAFPTWSHDGKSIVYVSVALPEPRDSRSSAERRTAGSTRARPTFTRFPSRASRAARRRLLRLHLSTARPRPGSKSTIRRSLRTTSSSPYTRSRRTGDVRQPQRRALGRSAPAGADKRRPSS